MRELLNHFKRLHRSGKGWSAQCPAHDDRHNSLSISVGSDGKILLKCFAGCPFEAILEGVNISPSDLFPSQNYNRRGAGGIYYPRNRATVQPSSVTSSKSNGKQYVTSAPDSTTLPEIGCTLEQYAEAKKLPTEYLRELGLTDFAYLGKPAVRIPYLDENGTEGPVRFRLALYKTESHDERFRWQMNSKLMLYRLDRLDRARQAGYAVLVEGESDCHTLWYYGIPAFGIPGANNWKEDWANYFNDIEKIYVIIEPDRGGEAMRLWLSRSRIRDRVYLVEFGEAKDPSELHCANPDKFLEQWDRAITEAVMWEGSEQGGKGADGQQVYGLPERPSSKSNDYQNGNHTINDALSPLRSLSDGAMMTDIERALRDFADAVKPLDDLERGLAREDAIKILRERGYSSPARLIDAALPKTEEKREAAKGIALRDPELWPEPVEGAALLDEIVALIRRYISATDHFFNAVALWIVYTHAFDVFDVSPLLAITSPDKRCGKSTLLNLLSALVPRPLSMSNITSSALFRTVEKYSPTLLIDEADSFLTNNEELRGILNSGHRKTSAYVIRTTGDNYEPQMFATWCPKAIALIGALPGTIEDRAIIIRLQRKRPTEKQERLRFDRLGEFEPLRSRAARWATDLIEQVCAADPDIPPEIMNDRARDNWRPLIAIADAAGGDWPRLARDTARAMAVEAPDSESAGTLLLGDLNLLFKDDIDRLTSDEIIQALNEMESRPWAEWRRGNPLTKVGLSHLLRPFGIKPQKWREGNNTLRGYLRSDFDDAFARYLVNNSPHSPHSTESTTCSESNSPQDTSSVASWNDSNPLKTNDVASVATQKEQVEREVIEI